MKRFRFSLAPLLKVRELGERLAEGRLLAARRAVAACLERLAPLRQSLAELGQRLEEAQATGQPLADWPASFEQSSRLEAAIRAAEADLAKAEAGLRQAQAEWEQAARQVEVLETLRREQFGLHRLERQRQEQQRLDEAGLRQWSQAPRDEEAR
ncbi:MAG: flagellar export protein FliJ [Gemmataceae bacterium]|nr:flagellar export protein FliJ [Gemmataceae bacterium]